MTGSRKRQRSRKERFWGHAQQLVPLIRASEILSMSFAPCFTSFTGNGVMPQSRYRQNHSLAEMERENGSRSAAVHRRMFDT